MQKDREKQNLFHGDKATIAKLTGYSREYVKKVLDPNDKRTNKKIEETAKRLVEMRESIAAGLEPHNIHVA